MLFVIKISAHTSALVGCISHSINIYFPLCISKHYSKEMCVGVEL